MSIFLQPSKQVSHFSNSREENVKGGREGQNLISKSLEKIEAKTKKK